MKGTHNAQNIFLNYIIHDALKLNYGRCNNVLAAFHS